MYGFSLFVCFLRSEEHHYILPRLHRLYCIHPALCFIYVSSERHPTFLFREVSELSASSKQVEVSVTHFVYEHRQRNFMELKTSLQAVCVLVVFSFSFPPSSGTVKRSLS